MHIGQSKVAALEMIGEFGVLDPEKMQDGRMQIVDVYLVFDRVEPKFVGFALSRLRQCGSQSAFVVAESHRTGLVFHHASRVVPCLRSRLGQGKRRAGGSLWLGLQHH